MSHYALDVVSWARNKAQMIEATEHPLEAWESLRASGALWEEALSMYGDAEARTAMQALKLFRRMGGGGRRDFAIA